MRRGIQVRTVIPFFFRPYYFVFMFGPDMRRHGLVPARPIVRRERNSPLGTVFILITVLMWLIFGATVFTALVIYLLKSYAGIDLVHGSHPLQVFFRKIYLCH